MNLLLLILLQINFASPAQGDVFTIQKLCGTWSKTGKVVCLCDTELDTLLTLVYQLRLNTQRNPDRERIELEKVLDSAKADCTPKKKGEK